MIGGQVIALPVGDTQTVRRGDILLQLDPRDSRIALAQARAELAKMRRQFGQTTAAGSALGAQVGAREAELPSSRLPIDTIGLILIIVWIAALQLILDLGREQDWFRSSTIVLLSVIAIIGFAVFLAWELTQENPVVDLRVFRYRGFTAAVVVQSFGYAAFFAGVVLIPQWLQSSLGYTATAAGFVTAGIGLGAFIMSPIAANMIGRMGARGLACFGLLWLSATSILWSHWASGADFWTLAIPQLVQGFGVPFFSLR